MDFDLSPDHELIRRTVRDFAEGEVAPVAEALAHEKRFPYEIVAKLGELGLMGNDDRWCDAVRAAGEATGERVWRLPLDPAYDELIKGRYADLINSSEGRKAQSITAAALLAKFAGDVPWAHLDIAGVADALGRPYAAKGASGWGVRLLVELAATMP